jgi:hypothetical protein
VPLISASQNRLIKDIHVINEDKWKIKFLKTIYFNYNKAPFFNQIFGLLEDVLMGDFNSITDLNYFAILKTCSYLNIETEIVRTSSIYENYNLKGESRILDICLKEKASVYINPIGGLDLYNRDKFSQNNINLFFIKSNLSKYKQFLDAFIPGLSIIDIMMFNSPDEIKTMLNQYELI